jgi:hypothetical protein
MVFWVVKQCFVCGYQCFKEHIATIFGVYVRLLVYQICFCNRPSLRKTYSLRWAPNFFVVWVLRDRKLDSQFA